MIIAIDVDDVTLNTVDSVLFQYNQDYRDNLAKASVTAWDISQFVKPECGRHIYDYFETPSTYVAASLVSNARAGIREIKREGHRVIFVTTPAPGTAGVKQSILSQHGLLEDRKNYVECADKSLVRADMLIDDGVHNLENFHGGRVIFDQPWNRNQSIFDSWRAMNWNEVVGIVRAYDAALKLAETQRVLG